MCTSDLNSDFTYAWSDRLHRFPIVWIQSLLHAPQLETGQPYAQEQGTPEDTARAAEPDERLIWHRSRQYTSVCITLATKRNSQHPCPPTVRTDGAHAVPAASERNESDACQDCSYA